MSTRSQHIASQLNSVMHYGTVCVDLTSNIFSETIIDNILKGSNVRFSNRTYVDAVAGCWQTLSSYQFNDNIRGCNSPNFAKNWSSWWPEINHEVSNILTSGQFAIIKCW